MHYSKTRSVIFLSEVDIRISIFVHLTQQALFRATFKSSVFVNEADKAIGGLK